MITNLMALIFLYEYINICSFEFVLCIYLGGKVYNGQWNTRMADQRNMRTDEKWQGLE